MRFDLLKKAIAVIEAIPDNVIDLVAIEKKTDCGTVCCAAGWLAQDPEFKALGLSMVPLEVRYRGYEDQAVARLMFRGDEMWWDSALNRLFETSGYAVSNLFGVRGEGSLGDEEDFPGNDKELWLARVRQFISVHEHYPEPV